MSKPAPTSDERQVLADIRRALGRSETLAPAPLDPFVEKIVEEESEALVARFTQEATAVGARVYEARDGEEACSLIAQICDKAGVDEVALSSAGLLAEINLPARLAAYNLLAVATADFGPNEREELIARLADCGAGVTTIDYAIAETGTLVLTSDEEHALLASLLPPIHIAVLCPQQIVGNLAEVVSNLGVERMRRAEPCRSATFITGPSRTGDVELTLSIGVHGPKELHVIILGDR